MNETQKPFACSEKDCEMTFDNDHLNWHQKKHNNMMLNLGLAINDVADQTPTPTRFIRNCEEVGLFQDLQNENPFDEIFKKAIELTKTGTTLNVPETNSDDTLHTPHILPHVEENRKSIGNVNTSQDDNNSQSTEFSLNTIPIENICTNLTDKESNNAEIIIMNDEEKKGSNIKLKIKEALQSRGKHKKVKQYDKCITASSISILPFHNLTIEKGKNKSKMDRNKNTFIDQNREKLREMNRAAQIRCRKRKQIRWKEMEEEIQILKNENKRLKLENYNLQRQLLNVKKKLESRVSPVPAAIPVLSDILPKLQKVNPLIIQVLPSTPNLVVPLTENLSPVKIENVQGTSKMLSDLNNDIEQKSLKKNLRKIIPKIIEN